MGGGAHKSMVVCLGLFKPVNEGTITIVLRVHVMAGVLPSRGIADWIFQKARDRKRDRIIK